MGLESGKAHTTAHLVSSKVRKQIHKAYLSWKANSHSVLTQFLSRCMLIFILMIIIIIINANLGSYNNPIASTQPDNQLQLSANTSSLSISNTNETTRIIPASKNETWRFVENHPEFAINTNPNLSDPIYIPLKHPWGTVYTPNRVLCMIPTLWPDRKWKMDLISETWGPGCTKLIWVVDKASNAPTSYAGFDILSLPLTRHQNHTVHVRNIWEKVHRTWTTIYQTSSLLKNFEWFIKADDDTFIVTENLFGFLRYYDPSYPHYLGHSLRHRWYKENVIFNSGTCYVLSRQAVIKMGKYSQYMPTVHPPPSREHCVDRVGAGEDPATATCLLGVGIRPENTLDHELRERFLIFRDTDHVKMWREDTWYWKYRAQGVADGEECCSPYLVSMHNYKTQWDAPKLYPKLMKKYNQPKNWDNIILPPRPRLVMYDRNDVDFEVDEYLNVVNPPHGQRVYKGIGKEWQCHDCRVGDIKDKWWTEWWDDVDNQTRSQHVNDPYSPLRK